MRRLLLSLFCGLLASSGISAGENWAQFRGPGGLGVAPKADLPVTWTPDSAKWRTPIYGKGWSSPVVWGEQIWLTTATPEGTRLYAICVDLKTGKILHNILVFEIAEPQKAIEKNSYASPTPAIEEGRVYVHYGAHGTACLNTKTGEKIWTRQDLPCNHWRGPASSPIINGNHLFLQFDGYDLQYVVALDKRNGKTIWKRDRNDDFDYKTDNGDLKKGFGTPAIYEIGGRKHLICPAAVAAVAYAPETGKTLWTVRTGGMNASAVPLFHNGLVYLSNGMGKFLAVRPDPEKGKHEAKIVWTKSRTMSRAPSQILLGNRIYMAADQGFAICMEASSGKILWQERIGGRYFASPLYANGNIYCFGELGKVVVVAAKDKYRKLASFDMGEGFMASPAVVGNTMILRTKKALYRIEK